MLKQVVFCLAIPVYLVSVWIDLNEAMKDEIITRTEYNVRNGNAVPFPESEKSMLGFE